MKLRYELSMSVEAAEERLNQHINSDHHLWVLLAQSLLIPFYNKVGMFGRLGADKLWLIYICGGHRYAIRCFFAEFIDLNGTTILQGKFRFSILTWMFLILPCCGILLIGSTLFRYQMFWIPYSILSSLLYVALVLGMGLHESKPLERKTEEFLRDLYAAELVGSSD